MSNIVEQGEAAMKTPVDTSVNAQGAIATDAPRATVDVPSPESSGQVKGMEVEKQSVEQESQSAGGKDTAPAGKVSEVEQEEDVEMEGDAHDASKGHGSDEEETATDAPPATVDVPSPEPSGQVKGMEVEKQSVEQESQSVGDKETAPAEEVSEVEQEADVEMEGDAHNASKGHGISQSTIDKINSVKIKKIKRDEEEDKPEASARKIAVQVALKQYTDFKKIHDSSLKAFTEYQKTLDPESADVDGELEWMLHALTLSEQSLIKKEERVNALVTQGNTEVEIVPFRPPAPRVIKPIVKRRIAPIKTGSSNKRGNPYIDDEAAEDNSEDRKEGCGGKKKKQREYKSEEIYVSDGEFRADKGASTTDEEAAQGDDDESEDESEDDTPLPGPNASMSKGGQVVMAKDVVKKKPAAREVSPDPIEYMPTSESSIYHNGKSIMDITMLLKGISVEEDRRLRRQAKVLNNYAFDWGEAFAESVIGTVNCWNYHENSQLDQPTNEALQPVIVLMKQMAEDKGTLTRIKTCPRLIQIAETDPYLTPDSICWHLIAHSTTYPWEKRNRVFRAFHSMACRTTDNIVWSKVSDLQNKVHNAHLTIHRILQESVELISYDAQHHQIEIKTTGQHAVQEDMVPMSQSIAWLHQQVMIKAQQEEEAKAKKIHHQGISHLQRKILLIITGMMLVYERDVYNRELNKFQLIPRTKEEINDRRKELGGSVINQLSDAFVRQNPARAIRGLKRNEIPTADALSKVTDAQIVKQASDDTYELRRQALQALACFFMFGTSGLFHCWAWPKEQKMKDAAVLIHLSTVLAERRQMEAKDHPHVFYQRAWSRMDHHIYTILRRFISTKDPTSFKKKVNWPNMTATFQSEFSPTKLAYLFTLDLCLEMHSPLSSRTPDGSVAPDFEDNKKRSKTVRLPMIESFRSVFSSGQGPITPVTNPSAMYQEKNGSKVTKRNPLKAISEAKEKARVEMRASEKSQGANQGGSKGASLVDSSQGSQS